MRLICSEMERIEPEQGETGMTTFSVWVIWFI